MSGSNLGQSDIEELVACAVEILADGKVTFGELVFLGGKLAGKVSQLAHLSGKEKEQLVLKVVEMALHQVLKEKKKSMSAEEFSAFFDRVENAKQFVHETLPSVLTVVVQASKGQLDFHVATKTGWSLMRNLCSCWGVRLPEEPKKVLELEKVEVVETEKVVDESVEKPAEPIEQPVEQPEEKSESSVVRQETMPQLPHQPDEESKTEEPLPNKEVEERPQEEVKAQE